MTTEDAIRSYRQDARFRAMVMSCVSEAIHRHGPIDPDRAEQHSLNLAELACAILLERIYTEDQELRLTRHERDLLRQHVERLGVLIQPAPIIVMKPPNIGADYEKVGQSANSVRDHHAPARAPEDRHEP